MAREIPDLTLAEGATAGSDRQTRSKGQAVPVGLGPLDKHVFDERFAVPKGDKQFIEGSKELYDSSITPALRHIVRSAQRYGTKSKIHKTPKGTVSSSEGSLPYPIRLSTFYPVDDPSIGGRQPCSANPAQSTEQLSPSEDQGSASQTPHSSGRATHLTNPVNPLDESVHDLVTPPSLPRRPPPLHRTPVRSLPEVLSLTAPERKVKGKVSSLYREPSDQDTDNSQSEERNKFNPYKLTYAEISEEGKPEDFEIYS